MMCGLTAGSSCVIGSYVRVQIFLGHLVELVAQTANPVTEHADKLCIDLKLTLKRFQKASCRAVHSSGMTYGFELKLQNCLCDLRKVSNSV